MRTTVLGGVLALVLSFVAACSSAGGAAATTPMSSSDVLAVWQRFAVCARAHGDPDLADPVFDANGKVQFPGAPNAAPDSVRVACSHLLDGLPPDRSPSGRPPTNIAGLLQFARCMRDHGFPDWPDPKSDGTFPSAQLPSVKTPAVVAAMGACDHLNPDPGGHVYGS